VVIEPRYLDDHVLQADLRRDKVFRAYKVKSAKISKGDALFSLSFLKQKPAKRLHQFADTKAVIKIQCRVRFYSNNIVRIMFSRAGKSFIDKSPMLEWDSSIKKLAARLKKTKTEYAAYSRQKTGIKTGGSTFNPIINMGNRTRIQMQAEDLFLNGFWDSLAVSLVQRKNGTTTWGMSLHIDPGEHFCGTGERFDRMDLFGRQIDLVNDDTYGCNNARAYKNVPLVISSRPYGIFMHSTGKMRLDIGRQSTRALQWLVDDDIMDIFFIGGGTIKNILRNYRRITGIPAMPPLWSYGAWMSRMTYLSDRQATGVADRLRKEKYPMDVIHLDTGWFEKDWQCTWRFSKKNFPDPVDFFRRMRKKGFRVSLWQYPYIGPKTDLWPVARKNRYVGMTNHPKTEGIWGGTIDFTNPKAVRWYKALLENVLNMGAAAIKVDFGENLHEKATHKNIKGAMYRNLFALLYQRAVWEITAKTKEEPLIWARSSWAGSQRYPVHWGGDAASTFDGLAGTICGGLHFGLSGFAFRSHDVGGFHGLPDFMKDRPGQALYARWTQVGTFTSHMRFHGTTPREPWEYPKVARIVREWLKFRYALIPYILSESRKCIKSGLPMLRSLVIDWCDDNAAWAISDQYMFGSDFMVCPVLNESGVRDVYLPEGRWVDFWSGKILNGPLRIKKVKSPLSRIPLYVRFNAKIKFAESVQCTDQLKNAKKFTVTFNKNYTGFKKSRLARRTGVI
jgi:alpha-D-xyloside xylohydrolase